MPIDEAKMQAFLGQAVGDVGAAMSAVLSLIGDKLGLYKAMAGAGPLSVGELARQKAVATDAIAPARRTSFATTTSRGRVVLVH